MVSQISASLRIVEAVALLELQAREAHRAVTTRRLLLLPAKHLEERLRLGLVAAFPRDALDGLLVAGLREAVEHGEVLLADAEPLRRRALPSPERGPLRCRVTEPRAAVLRGDRGHLEQLRNAEDALGRHHARRLLRVVQHHRFTEGAEIIVVEADRPVLLLDRLAGARLNEHERGARHLEIAPVGFRERVAREVRHQVRVELVDVEDPRVQALGGRHVEAGLHGHGLRASGELVLALRRVPVARDVDARAIVPEVRRRVEDEIEQLLRGANLPLGKRRSVLVGHDLRELSAPCLEILRETVRGADEVWFDLRDEQVLDGLRDLA